MLKTDKIPRITKGLRNCGNITCYFISSMQLFFNIEEIQEYFFHYNYYNENENENEYNKLQDDEKELILILNNLKKIYEIIFRDVDDIQNPSEYDKLIKDTVSKIIVNVDLTKQQESFEILIQIFTKFNNNFDFNNADLQKFKVTLIPLISNELLIKRTFDNNKYKCNDIFNINPVNEMHVLIKRENINFISKKTNFIDEIFKINIENIIDAEYMCNDPKYDVNGKRIEINEMQIKTCYNYNIQTKYIIINFIPYNELGIFKYGKIELNKSFSNNNINYKIKGIIIHIGAVGGGHYYYYHFLNNDCIEYNDMHVNKKTLLVEDDKYIFYENEHPVVIIYEQKDNINPSEKKSFDCNTSILENIVPAPAHIAAPAAVPAHIVAPVPPPKYIKNKSNKIHKLKILIDQHFSKLENLLK